MLVGPIPSQLLTLSNLVMLDLQDNDLTGTIPSTIGELTDLRKSQTVPTPKYLLWSTKTNTFLCHLLPFLIYRDFAHCNERNIRLSTAGSRSSDRFE